MTTDNHCVDCCCARSWAALGVTKYDGKDIPEHIAALRDRIEAQARVIAAAQRMRVSGDMPYHGKQIGDEYKCTACDAVLAFDAALAKLDGVTK